MEQLKHGDISSTPSESQITILCDGIDLPSNIGAIFRLADAFGVEKVIFGRTDIELNSRKVKQVSRSTHEWVPQEKVQHTKEALQYLISSGYRPIALEITKSSIALQNLDSRKNDKIALVIGSEIVGVSEELLDLCEQAYHIPLHGKNSSMNVANALAIALYQLNQ